MIKKVFLLYLILAISISACKKDSVSQITEKQTIPEASNIFSSNKKLIQIFQAHNNLDIEFLKHSLSDTNPQIRYYSLLMLTSLGDTSSLYMKISLLNDTNQQVRLAAAYSIGEQKNPYAEDILIKRYYNEKSPVVRSQILEALGKCGTERSLYFLSHLNPTNEKDLQGLAWALVRFAIRNKNHNYSDQKALDIITDYKTKDKIKQIISFYFIQPNVNTQNYYKKFIHLYYNSQDPILKKNLIKAIGKNDNKVVYNFLKKQIFSQCPECQIAAIQAIQYQNNSELPRLMIELLHHENIQVEKIAAKYFVYNGLPTEANYYFEIAKQITNWQPRSLMLHAALKFAPDSLKDKISKSIISGFNATKNYYEKAALLSAFSFYPYEYEFVRKQIFYADKKIITTTAIKTAVKMRLQPNFDQLSKKYLEDQGFNLNKEFGLIFKEAMRKGDNAQIFYSSQILKNKKLNLIEDYENTFFINQAIAKLQLPKDIKAYKSTCRLLKLYTGDTCGKITYRMSPIDWNLAQKIKNNIKVKVKSTKGEFIIELYPEKAPAAVSSFLKNLLDSYYNNIYVFRLVPNKSVWFSSRRGDEWPDQNIAHPITLYPYHIEKGSIAMQLIDKGLESIQWFISLGPSPEMDGKYTVFGKIIQGMAVVQKLEIGDKIINIQIYN